MEKILQLFTYVDGVNDTPFPSAEEQIEIVDFRYNATRMGNAPTITANGVKHSQCLDNLWTKKVYATFNGEKYYIRQIPTSSYSNTDARYSHDLQLVSERVALDSAYFFDVVTPDAENDQEVSNSSKFSFFGNIDQFVSRINDSLVYSGLDYNVVVDDTIVTKEDKMLSFEDEFISNVLQEIYKTFELPYYFVGKTIHVGFTDNVITDVFEYGVDNQLLSIKKQNANFKVVNRCSGTGSDKNIPYYYPNNSPKGVIRADVVGGFTARIEDYDAFSNKIALDRPITYSHCIFTPSIQNLKGNFFWRRIEDGVPQKYWDYNKGDEIDCSRGYDANVEFKLLINVTHIGKINIDMLWSHKGEAYISSGHYREIEGIKWNEKLTLRYLDDLNEAPKNYLAMSGGQVQLDIKRTGNYELVLSLKGKSPEKAERWKIAANIVAIESYESWLYEGRIVEPSDVGIVVEGTPVSGNTITQKLVKWVTPMHKLMPPLYRETDGKQRFYNALNNTYLLPDSQDKYYTFNNPYTDGNPLEHIIEMGDIMPTIKGMKNAAGKRIDSFLGIAFDDDDNDETEEIDGQIVYKHPYFFVKLQKFDGENGFNLFEHAIDHNEMTIAMTSGHCGACEFKIAVSDDELQKNLVQVDEQGNLLRDKDGNVRCGRKHYQDEGEIPQDRQNDTINNEVWIALEKDFDTYGELLPNSKTQLVPTIDDTFVILHINLPQAYITSAEERLKDAIVRYMSENNDEKFSFSIKFSSIYFAQHPDVLAKLNENARITVRYNGMDYLLYVNSFSYNMNSNNTLPEVSVELKDILTISQGSMKTMVDNITDRVIYSVGNPDILGVGSQYFVSKNEDDTVGGVLDFEKGATFGDRGEVHVDESGNSTAVFDFLEIKKKATFTSLEIQKKTHVGGQLIVSLASMTCNKVEENPDFYRCYFTNDTNSGQETTNDFVVGDLAISQTFNNVSTKYYWRAVVGVGNDYIDLSKTDCDVSSDAPSIDDVIVQFGNKTIAERQAAQIISSHGSDSPSLVMYNGIDGFSTNMKNIVGIVWNKETQEPKLYCYGDMWLGDREDAAVKNQYLCYYKNQSGERILELNGALLANLLEVRDSEKKEVVAGMNGGDTIESDRASKIMLFAGGNGKNATTKIYADGHIKSNSVELKGKITADEGVVGGWQIVDKWLVAAEEITADRLLNKNVVGSLQPNGYISKSDWTTKSNQPTKEIVAIVGDTQLNNNLPYDIDGAGAYVSSVDKTNSAEAKKNVAIYARAKGHVGNKNYAFYCPEGQFAGLRPKLAFIEYSSLEATDLDHTIVSASDAGTKTLTLPASPELGQRYEVWKQGVHTLYIDGNGHDLLLMGRTQTQRPYWASDFYGKIDLLFVGLYWYVVFENNRYQDNA